MKPVWDMTEVQDEEDERLESSAGASSAPFWNGPVGIGARLGCVVAALVSVTLAVVAGTDLHMRREATAAMAAVPATAPDLLAPARSSVPSVPSAVFEPPMPKTAVTPTEVGPFLPRYPRLSPSDLCKAIELASSSGGWAPSPVYGDEWECISSENVKASAKDAKPAEPKSNASSSAGTAAKSKSATAGLRIFAMGRGTERSGVRYVRFKIAANDDAQADIGARRLVDQLQRLYDALKWPLPEEAAIATRLLHDFSRDDDGTRIALLEERMNPLHYNLIVTFPKPLPVMASAETNPISSAKRGSSSSKSKDAGK